MNRCTGHCCREIKIPVSPEQLVSGAIDGREIDEGELLAEILIPVRRLPDDPDPRWLYKCSKLTTSGDCSIHESKPKMCADYPYGAPCGVDGCTSSEALMWPRRKDATP